MAKRVKPGPTRQEVRRALNDLARRSSVGDAFDIDYKNGNSVGKTLDDILNPYKAPQVSLSGGGTWEVGQTVANVVLTWSVSVHQTIVSQVLTDAGNVGTTATNYTFNGANLTTNKTYTIVVDDGSSTGSSSTTFSFRHRRRWGLSADATLDNDGVLALTSELATARTQTRTFNASAQYLWFAWPESWGEATFRVNGLMNSAWITNVQPHLNASGHTTNYRLYRSQYLQSGSNINVQVL
jgi:hypothetical protein